MISINVLNAIPSLQVIERGERVMLNPESTIRPCFDTRFLTVNDEALPDLARLPGDNNE
jgi:hypothetical protein